MNEADRPYHSIANLYPLMEGEEFKALKESIVQNGLLEPIVVLEDGAIIDGRNRHRACIETGTAPHFERYRGKTDARSLWAYVKAKNEDRRHLTSSQCAAIAIDADELVMRLEQEAQERQATSTGGANPQLSEEIREAEKGKVSEHLADIFGTNPRYIEYAKKLKREAPDLFEKVKSRELTIPKAMKELKKRKRKEKPLPHQDPLPAPRSPRLIVSRAENMPEIETESVDIIITSPPYNLGSSSWPMGGEGRQPREDGIGYADSLDELAYQNWQVECLIEFYRVAKQGASLFYNHKVRNVQGQVVHPMDWLRNERNPWIIRQEIIWDRGSTHNHSETLFWPHDERIYWMTKGRPALPDHPIGMPSIWKFHGPVPSTWHPAPFSKELPRRCLEAVGRNDSIVLDPFAGSCMTCVVALELGYDAIGIDIEEEYLRRAVEENGWTMPSAT